MPSLYDVDFYAWTQAQAKSLRQRQWELLDLENLIEEMETLGRQEKRELVHRLGLLIGHRLKWDYQASHRSNSWRATIREQHRQVQRLLNQSPSLKPYLPEALALAYEDGRDLAVRDTNLPDETFPTICPYALAQLLECNDL